MGVELMQFIQSFHSELLDFIFIWITKLGIEEFYMVFLPFVYWVVSRDVGFRLTLMLMVAALTNGFLKDSLMLPRPSESEGVRILYKESGGGYGFPSGHAQDNAAIWGYVAAKYGPRRRYLYWIAGAIIFLVSLSRLYLGLHYPTDVLGGLVFGFALVFVALWVERRSENWSISPITRWLFAALPLAALVFYHNDYAFKIVGFMVGTVAGYLFDLQYIGFSARSSIGGQLLKLVIGYGGFLALRVGTSAFVPAGAPQLLRYALLGLWATALAPAIFRRLGLVKD